MDLPVTTEQLIEAVGSEAAEDTPLARVVAAAMASSQLGALADAVLDRFVRDARDAGNSWADIGAALGVTRQAAHLRFNPRQARPVQPWPEQFSEQAREVIGQAVEQARQLGHNYVGTEHVLLPLLQADDDPAGRILRKLGLTEDAVRRHAERIVGSGEPGQRDALGLAPRLKKSFELARGHAKRLGHPCPGTEHLLLGLVDVEGVAAEILAAEHIPPDQLRTEIAQALGVDVSKLSSGRRRTGRLR